MEYGRKSEDGDSLCFSTERRRVGVFLSSRCLAFGSVALRVVDIRGHGRSLARVLAITTKIGD